MKNSPFLSETKVEEETILASNGHAATEHQALFFLDSQTFNDIYGPEEQKHIASRVPITGSLVTAEIYRSSSRAWPGIDLLFSGWGMTVCDTEFLERFPDLKIIFYASGSIRYFVTEEFWARGIKITTGASANAIPVAEYTLSQILFGLKHGWQKALYIRQHHHRPPFSPSPGAYGSVVGLISLGLIGRLVVKLLRSFNIRVIAYDPFIDEKDAREMGVELVSLEEVFRRSDVVSCHAPDLVETRGMIHATHFEAMKPGATFLNTARGRVVDEAGMVNVLGRRSDLFAILDVTHPEPPLEGSPLYKMENIILTPHIAGSIGMECRRMGQLMMQELDLYLAGQPLRHEILRQKSLLIA